MCTIILFSPDRGAFDLSPGCAVTDIEETRGGMGNHKMYSFWIVWPFDKNEKPKEELKAEDSDNDDDKPKDLKQVLFLALAKLTY